MVLSTLQVTPVTCTEQKELGLTAYTTARETGTGYSESPYLKKKMMREKLQMQEKYICSFYLISTDL